MTFRKKKSLSIVILGLLLFVFAVSLRKPGLGKTEKSNEYFKGNIVSKASRKVAPNSRITSQLSEEFKLVESNSASDRGNTQDRTNSQVVLLQNFGKEEETAENKWNTRRAKVDGTAASRVFINKTPHTNDGTKRRRFPTAIILGVKKAGTRALLDILSMHPNVIGSPNEVYFFNGYHTKGLEWYRQQMPLSSPDQMTIEKSPTYFTSVENTQVVNRMFIFSRSTPDWLKLIVVVRDPVKRCLSEYTDLLARSKKGEIPPEVEDFGKLVLHRNGTVNPESELVKTGLYVQHLDKWLEYFPGNEIHFVSGEELVKNPYKEVKAVEKFLELGSFFTERNFEFNEAKGFPCFRPDASRDHSYCLPPNKGRKHAEVPSHILELLRRFYHPLNKKFYSTVKQDFKWS